MVALLVYPMTLLGYGVTWRLGAFSWVLAEQAGKGPLEGSCPAPIVSGGA
jgi:hypothetical protein